ncbi:hypothetical protein CYMTET_8211 [Cymbomonas tetramitiformis]|uniref:Uncharacterized protein n=1 Tax=Cymbomonas tetramitiformis TaxID=36881 RepID=A0AAE0GTH8_9CHLO|nr:hypothetical protein CYMTET_8211 [Cymbomonas tetramitiformis]
MEHRWVPARGPARFNGLCKSVQLGGKEDAVKLANENFSETLRTLDQSLPSLEHVATSMWKWLIREGPAEFWRSSRRRPPVLGRRGLGTLFWTARIDGYIVLDGWDAFPWDRGVLPDTLERNVRSTVVRFASDVSAQLPRKGGAPAMVVALPWPGQPWHRKLEDLAPEVVFAPRRRDLFAPIRLGRLGVPQTPWLGRCDVPHSGPPVSSFLQGCRARAPPVALFRVGMQLEVYRRDDDARYPGTMAGVSGGTCHVVRRHVPDDGGDVEDGPAGGDLPDPISSGARGRAPVAGLGARRSTADSAGGTPGLRAHTALALSFKFSRHLLLNAEGRGWAQYSAGGSYTRTGRLGTPRADMLFRRLGTVVSDCAQVHRPNGGGR